MSRRKLTIPEYQRLFAALPRGLTVAQIAQRLRLSYADVYRLSTQLGYPRQRRQSLAKQLAPKFACLPAGLTVPQVAKRLRISYGQARLCCSQLGYSWQRCQPAAARLEPKFARLPPGLTVPQLAGRLRISHEQAYRYSRELGYQLKLRSPPGQQKVSRKQWQQVDWAIRNAEIARRMGVSPERVRQVRQELGQPPPSYMSVAGNEA